MVARVEKKFHREGKREGSEIGEREIVQHWNTRIAFPEDVCLTMVVKTNENGFSCLSSTLFPWVLSN